MRALVGLLHNEARVTGECSHEYNDDSRSMARDVCDWIVCDT